MVIQRFTNFCQPPLGKKLLGYRWIYKVKYRADGSSDRHKERLVAQGFIQQDGVDFMDPTISLNDVDGDPVSDVSAYRRLIGLLMYVTLFKPYIYFAVNKLSQFVTKLRTPRLSDVHQVLQYLQSSPALGILFPAKSSLRVTAFADSDCGSCAVLRKSTTGFCLFFGHSLVRCKSKKQVTVSRSSAEAEYQALASLTLELLWIKQILRSLEVPLSSTIFFLKYENWQSQ